MIRKATHSTLRTVRQRFLPNGNVLMMSSPGNGYCPPVLSSSSCSMEPM